MSRFSDLDRRVLWYVRELLRGDASLAREWLRDEAYELRIRVARSLAVMSKRR